MTYTTQAIVLKKIPAGEADAVVVLYTRDFGKLRAFAQGVKKESAKLKGHIEPLSLISMQFVLGVSGERLTYAQMMQSWPSIRNDFDRYATAACMLEHIDRHCLDGEKDSGIWELLVANLAFVEQCEIADAHSAVSSFERDFLQALGYGEAQDMSVLGAPLATPSALVYNGK